MFVLITIHWVFSAVKYNSVTYWMFCLSNKIKWDYKVVKGWWLWKPLKLLYFSPWEKRFAFACFHDHILSMKWFQSLVTLTHNILSTFYPSTYMSPLTEIEKKTGQGRRGSNNRSLSNTVNTQCLCFPKQ